MDFFNAMDLTLKIGSGALTVIGGLSVILRLVAAKTPSQKDDLFSQKVDQFITRLKQYLAMFTLNVDDRSLNVEGGKLEITVKRRK